MQLDDVQRRCLRWPAAHAVWRVPCDVRGLTLNAPVGELGVVSTLSVPQKGQEGQRNVW